MSLPAPKHDVEPDNLTTMELGECLPMTAEVIDGHLHIGGVDMVKVAEEFGTALYVYDQADLENRMETYRDAFASRYPNSDVIYASKAFLEQGGLSPCERARSLPRCVGRRRVGAGASR